MNLAASGYDADAVTTALLTSGRRMRFAYEWLDSRNSTLGWLPNVLPGATVANSALASVKRVLAITLHQGTDPGFDYTNDRIRPWAGVVMPDGGAAMFPLGVFLMAAPTRKFSRGSVSRECTGYDAALALTDDTVVSRFVVKAGLTYTDVIAELCVALPSMNIVPSDLTLPTDRIYDPGTPKLQIVNDFCEAISYGSLWLDGFGTGQVVPYVAPADAPSGFTYTDLGELAMFTPELDATLDLSGVPNYIVYSVSQPDRPVLTSTFANTDPNSPVSIPSRGRRVVKSDSSIDVATQVELDALVKRAAVNAANVYQSVTFSTPLMPIHENRDVITLSHSGLDLAGRFTETDWKMELRPGGQMSHTVRQVVNLDAALVGTPDDTQ